jgi:hypothetical protein
VSGSVDSGVVDYRHMFHVLNNNEIELHWLREPFQCSNGMRN